jgi:hypothetical protein
LAALPARKYTRLYTALVYGVALAIVVGIGCGVIIVGTGIGVATVGIG